jgi:hypothetical protein
LERICSIIGAPQPIPTVVLDGSSKIAAEMQVVLITIGAIWAAGALLALALARAAGMKAPTPPDEAPQDALDSQQ